MRVDGRLDELIYATVLPASDFAQLEPTPNAAATERTEVWVLYDADNIYVVFRCWETRPEGIVANDMQRDSPLGFTSNDSVGFVLDTFNSRRDGVLFTLNAAAGLSDGQVTNERQYNADWNPVWIAASARFDGGWTAELAVPLKSLRYRPAQSQVWGFNAVRHNLAKAEWSYFSPLPSSRSATNGLMNISYAGTIAGLELPPRPKNLEFKPYALGNVKTSRSATQVSRDHHLDAGGDVKYGVTTGLTADFTYNTDFAQVEADEQQVNLTRFSLFFPEKRELFLENQGTFAFGGAAASGPSAGASDVPVIFYSRRIGLNAGQPVPVRVGARLSGRMSAFSLGALSIQTGDDAVSGSPAANFSVLRVKRDVLRRSSIGGIFTRRSPVGAKADATYGMDASFAFFDNLVINSYWALARPTVGDQDVSYRTQLDYGADRYGLQLEHLLVGADFSPETGFVRRDDMRKTYAQLRFSPRPRGSRIVRKLSWIGSGTYIENSAGQPETKRVDAEFDVDFKNTDKLTVRLARGYEFLTQPFAISPTVTVPVGHYDESSLYVTWTFGQQRPVFGNLSFEQGTFYDGNKTAVTFSRGRVEVTTRLSMEPSVSVNRVRLASGRFTATVAGSRFTLMMTPRMFISALIQHNSTTNVAASNVRFRWEYHPGSELFVVFNEQRDTIRHSLSNAVNRVVIVKVNRLLRF